MPLHPNRTDPFPFPHTMPQMYLVEIHHSPNQPDTIYPPRLPLALRFHAPPTTDPTGPDKTLVLTTTGLWYELTPLTTNPSPTPRAVTYRLMSYDQYDRLLYAQASSDADQKTRVIAAAETDAE